MINYFKDCKSIEEVKETYRRLALKHHPDAGGDNDTMRIINLQYDEMKDKKFEGINFKTGEKYETTFNPFDGFRDIIDKLIRVKGIEIEVCGTWIWVSGDTKPHKDTLSNIGLKYSANKTAWYWHGGKYRRRSKKNYSLDEIREMYGSEKVEKEKEVRIA